MARKKRIAVITASWFFVVIYHNLGMVTDRCWLYRYE